MASTTVVKNEKNDRSNITPNIKNENILNLKTMKGQLLYKYHHTNMTVDLDNVNKISSGIDYTNLFNEETMYHYCNLLLDKYDTKIANLALFRDPENYGPQRDDINIYFHPFQWNNTWHLAIGFTKYNKILLVNCSDYSIENSVSSYPGFPEKVSITLKDFILFFKQKLSKNSIKYPRLFTDLFEPSTPFNAINLLAVIFGFCSDPISVTRSFCDPEYSPTKYDISDMHPIIIRMDTNFRQEFAIELEENFEHRETELIQSKKMNEEELADTKKQEYKEKPDLKKEEENLTRQKFGIEHRNRLLEEKKARENEYKKRQESLKRQYQEPIQTNEIVKRLHSLRPNGSINAPIEINELEDNKDESNDEQDKQNINLSNLKRESPSLEPEIQTKSNALIKKKREQELLLIFQVKYGIIFEKYILNLTLFADNNKMNLMYEFIKNICYNPLTNPSLFIPGTIEMLKEPYEIRDALMVTYRRRMKQEFDEAKFDKMLETDYKNQIIPLIFENGSIFLINIKTTDNFNCIVKLVCISNRSNRSERETMKNYAFRRLIEQYVAKYNRLVIRIRTSIVYVNSSSFYKLAMQSLYSLHHILWRNKFDLTSFKPKKDKLENYIVFFENIMSASKDKDLFQAELNFKRLIKHVLIQDSLTDESYQEMLG
jgi:hypothetical protein